MNNQAAHTSGMYKPRFTPGCLLAALCISPLLLCQQVRAGQEVDKTLTVDPLGVVSVNNPRGEIEVYGWNRNEVHIKGELDDLAEGLAFERTDNKTIIHVRLPEKNVNWGDGSELTVYVPARSKLVVEGISTDIQVNQVMGAISIHSINGDVEVNDSGSNTRINTVSGDIEVFDGTGSLKVVTTSGDLQAELEATSIFVDTMTGDVELELGKFETLALKAVSSSVQVEGQLAHSGRIAMETVDGDIELTLAEPVNAQIQAKTVARGGIDNKLTGDSPTRLALDQLLLITTAGDGSAQIQLSTVRGTIELERSD